MSIYSDKLAHLQVIIKCWYSVAHLCTSEAMLAHILGGLHFDDVMSYNSLTTSIAPRMLIGVWDLSWRPRLKPWYQNLVFLHSRIKDVQVVFNCQDSIAQTRTEENIHVCLFTGVVLDDVMSQSELSTSCFSFSELSSRWTRTRRRCIRPSGKHRNERPSNGWGKRLRSCTVSGSRHQREEESHHPLPADMDQCLEDLLVDHPLEIPCRLLLNRPSQLTITLRKLKLF